MILGPLYHWAPADRRASIREKGLLPFQKATVNTADGVVYPSVSLSPSPSCAWGYSGDLEWVSEIEQWDLWQVNLPDNAEVHLRPLFGRVLEEIKVHSAIPADHVWYVATREAPHAESPAGGNE